MGALGQRLHGHARAATGIATSASVVPRARPFDTFPVEVRAAYSPLYETCIRFLSGRVRWTFTGGGEGEPDVFEMEEADHWLW